MTDVRHRMNTPFAFRAQNMAFVHNKAFPFANMQLKRGLSCASACSLDQVVFNWRQLSDHFFDCDGILEKRSTKNQITLCFPS